MNEQQRDYVLRSVEERGRPVDPAVVHRRARQPQDYGHHAARARQRARTTGMTFDGSSIDGFSRVQEADVLAIPDPDTYELLPWADPAAPEARIFCDIHQPRRPPFEGDPRQVLRRHVKAAHEAGLTFYIAPDIEYFYFEPHRRQRAASARRRRLLRSHHQRRHRRTPQADDPHARDHGHSGRVQLPRGRSPASRRSTCVTPMPSRWPTR